MGQPYDYSIRSPMQAFKDSFNTVSSIMESREKKDAAEQAALQQQQMQDDFYAVSQNPTTDSLGKLVLKYPQLADPITKAHGLLGESEKQAKINQASQFYAAIESGNPELGISLLEEQAAAYENSGREKEAKALKDLIKLTELSPETAKTSAGLFLSSSMGSDKFIDTFSKLSKERIERQSAGAELTEKSSKARTAAIKADYAEAREIADLESQGWNILKIQEDIDIARENNKIAAMKIRQGKVNDPLKREELELKIDAAKRKRDKEIQEKVATAKDAFSQTDNMLSTINTLRQFDASTKEAALGPKSQYLPTLRGDTADFETLIETLKAQAFTFQIPLIAGKGLGALSDAEGAKLEKAFASFNPKQTPERFEANLNVAVKILEKARKNLGTKFGIDQPPVDLNDSETKPEEFDKYKELYLKSTPESSDYDEILQKYGVAR